MDELQRVPMPDNWRRPETGPMQFGDDWPGVFIRGDNAIHYALYMDALMAKADVEFDPIAKAAVSGMATLLRSCMVR